MSKELVYLSELIKEKNEIESKITNLIGRPAFIGHVGEFIASKIFDIKLEESASAKGIDGYFKRGNLKGKSVNIKFYTKNERLLDITPMYLPDYYLVMTGDQSQSLSSKGVFKPWCITSVYLFNAEELSRKVKRKKY